MAAAARAHGAVAAAAYRALTAVGALARPPQAGRHLYADLDELRGVLAARGITDSVELERELVRRIGPSVAGGHRFGDPRTPCGYGWRPCRCWGRRRSRGSRRSRRPIRWNCPMWPRRWPPSRRPSGACSRTVPRPEPPRTSAI
ncbi:hypothetical protein GCM10017744_029700 [Streptomyces antimycoticus]